MGRPPVFQCIPLLGLYSACFAGPRPPVAEGVPEPSFEASKSWIARGAKLPGGLAADLVILDGRIAAVVPPGHEGSEPILDLEGRFVAPALIDSHVHLAYVQGGLTDAELGCPGRDDRPCSASEMLAKAGFAAAIDLAAPIRFLAEPRGPIQVLRSGPMLTAPNGYPLNGWGHDGYGEGVATIAEANAAVDRLVAAGAQVIKVPFEGAAMRDEVIAAIVARAHHHRLKVVAHALSDHDALRAARLGVDALGHTPLEPLEDATIQALAGRAVISTLTAFGRSAAAVDNLRRLHAAGVVVLYGTDLGNRQITGVDEEELAALTEAGLSPAEILSAMSEGPATFFGLADLGALRADVRASFVVLDADPLQQSATLATPRMVVLDGVLVR